MYASPSFPLKGHLAFCHCYGCIARRIYLECIPEVLFKKKKKLTQCPILHRITQPVYSADEGILICGCWVCLRKPGAFIRLSGLGGCLFVFSSSGKRFSTPNLPQVPHPHLRRGSEPLLFCRGTTIHSIFFPTSQVTRKSVAGCFFCPLICFFYLSSWYCLFRPEDGYI